jgi:hypothetical protein
MKIEAPNHSFKIGDFITIEESNPIMKKTEIFVVTDIDGDTIYYKEYIPKPIYKVPTWLWIYTALFLIILYLILR